MASFSSSAILLPFSPPLPQVDGRDGALFSQAGHCARAARRLLPQPSRDCQFATAQYGGSSSNGAAATGPMAAGGSGSLAVAAAVLSPSLRLSGTETELSWLS
uniref:Uncharacterized protein n=1 Tax=Leersia perrieri TaxID=77586 RepID=A0A0D9XWQ6_9ORYZ